MSNEMKLIMENWRRNALQDNNINESLLGQFKRFLGFPPEELDDPTDFSSVLTAGDFLRKISAAVKIAALYQKEEFRKEMIVELGQEVIDTSLEFVKATPAIGNAIAAGQAVVKTANTIQMGMELLEKAKQVDKAAGKALKGIAGQLVAIDDSNIDEHPLAKIFNISDQKEAALRKEEIDNFANWFLVYLRENGDDRIQDAAKYADNKLNLYLQQNRGFRFS